MNEAIYLDTCALNRISDDHSQPRICEEADAVQRILDLVFAGRLRWIASTVLQHELSQNPDALRRLDNLTLLRSAAEIVPPDDTTRRAAHLLTRSGLAAMDALHLAICHQAKIDWLITTDDRFCKTAARVTHSGSTHVLNPVEWLQRRHLWLLASTKP